MVSRGKRLGVSAPRAAARIVVMLDFWMIASGVGFFAVAILYVIACEKM
jgi:hypothetical protein